MMKNLMEDLKNEVDKVQFTEEEQAYRRGFVHGVTAAITQKVTIQQANEWRNSNLCTGTPGSMFSKIEMHGVTKTESKAS